MTSEEEIYMLQYEVERLKAELESIKQERIYMLQQEVKQLKAERASKEQVEDALKKIEQMICKTDDSSSPQHNLTKNLQIIIKHLTKWVQRIKDKISRM